MLSLLRKWLSNSSPKEEQNSMKKFLIIGLGNIGPDYIHTRHNIGFKVVEWLADKHNASFQTVRYGALASIKIKGQTVLLLKPNTFMNLSGKAIQYWMQAEKIPIEQIFVITDDLNLPFGTIRIKPKGSDGGHNGLKSTQSVLQTSEYPRFRFGIGDAFPKGRQVDYVLGEWSTEERRALPERLTIAADAIESFVKAGLANTMNEFNGK
jgi:peptidyl-tRNA hydrolase, PTH1 family